MGGPHKAAKLENQLRYHVATYFCSCVRLEPNGPVVSPRHRCTLCVQMNELKSVCLASTSGGSRTPPRFLPLCMGREAHTTPGAKHWEAELRRWQSKGSRLTQCTNPSSECDPSFGQSAQDPKALSKLVRQSLPQSKAGLKEGNLTGLRSFSRSTCTAFPVWR